MQAKAMRGYESGLAIGQKKLVVLIASGPASYSVAGDPLVVVDFPHLDIPFGPCRSVSGTYRVEFQPNTASTRAGWTAIWIVAETASVPAAPVAAAVNLSAETVMFLAMGGDF